MQSNTNKFKKSQCPRLQLFKHNLCVHNMWNNIPEKIIITGTPGVGKTTIAKILSEKIGLEYISANEFLKKEKGIKKTIADLNKLKKLKYKKHAIIEGHLCCEVKLGETIYVLRLNPKELEKRLKKRKYSKKKIEDNILSELLDYCLIVSEKKYKKVIQIDCTGKKPDEIIKQILKQTTDRNPNWISKLEESYLKQYMQV